ncbi:D-aminopeptidase, partial [Tolypocladium capitatum]
VYWLPEIKYGVVSFANTAGSSNAAEEALVFKLVDEKLGIKEEDRIDPERKPIAPTTTIGKLAGTYCDPGYKTITLRVKSHVQDSAKQILTGCRENDTWPISFDLHHVSGDWWIMYLETPQNPSIYFRQYAQAEFKIGVDGAPTALQVQFDQSKEEGQGSSNKVLFNKIMCPSVSNLNGWGRGNLPLARGGAGMGGLFCNRRIIIQVVMCSCQRPQIAGL